ncbi:MAG: hypothetical protein PHU14_04665 [Methylovulum sp.]|nr:hypothetical protein [Methylovulum sp.]
MIEIQHAVQYGYRLLHPTEYALPRYGVRFTELSLKLMMGITTQKHGLDVMPKVLIIPHYQYENEFSNFLEQANAAQTDFKFYLLPPEDGKSFPLKKPHSDFLEILEFLNAKKKLCGLAKEDLLVAFYDGNITALDYGFTNLFIAGGNMEDLYPCTAAISLQFISWGILEQKYDYSLQRHALFHLVMCCLIGGYTKVTAHDQTYGCLLDFNNQLVSFNQKLQMGYYLCSNNQSGCYDAMQSECYGNSIIRLCQVLKAGIDHKKLQIIIQGLVMGNSINQYGSGDNIGNDKVMGNKIDTQINNPQDLVQASKDIKALLEQLYSDCPNDSKRVLGAKAVDQLEKNPELKSRILKGIQAGSFAALETMIDHPVAQFFIEGAKAAWKL